MGDEEEGPSPLLDPSALTARDCNDLTVPRVLIGCCACVWDWDQKAGVAVPVPGDRVAAGGGGGGGGGGVEAGDLGEDGVVE